MANLYITMPLSILMRFWPTAWYDYNPPLVPGGRATATRRSRLPLCRIVTIDCALSRNPLPSLPHTEKPSDLSQRPGRVEQSANRYARCAQFDYSLFIHPLTPCDVAAPVYPEPGPPMPQLPPHSDAGDCARFGGICYRWVLRVASKGRYLTDLPFRARWLPRRLPATGASL